LQNGPGNIKKNDQGRRKVWEIGYFSRFKPTLHHFDNADDIISGLCASGDSLVT